MDGKNVGLRLLGKALFTQETSFSPLLCTRKDAQPWERRNDHGAPVHLPSLHSLSLSGFPHPLPPRVLSRCNQGDFQKPKSYGVMGPIALRQQVSLESIPHAARAEDHGPVWWDPASCIYIIWIQLSHRSFTQQILTRHQLHAKY